ncbi:HopJ type III effector protein [Sediminicola sp. 1XM1-17]|uniref:HopJ type III effector protein n=1 Tax=Sediminicola sp. 1XM1-17 TaxID=3127702 RepID=UPI0030784002
MSIADFLKKLGTAPNDITFMDTMEVIEEHYYFEPVKFTNGRMVNEAGQNSGSCKLFSFAKLQGLNEAETLACFGDYYRCDVLKNPQGEDHQNIRNFMKTGWGGVAFEKDALTKKQSPL